KKRNRLSELENSEKEKAVDTSIWPDKLLLKKHIWLEVDKDGWSIATKIVLEDSMDPMLELFSEKYKRARIHNESNICGSKARAEKVQASYRSQKAEQDLTKKIHSSSKKLDTIENNRQKIVNIGF
ncbi:14704_t:CDS:2, partial [Gigaspora rosea]